MDIIVIIIIKNIIHIIYYGNTLKSLIIIQIIKNNQK